MRLVYLAGPYSADRPYDVWANIQEAHWDAAHIVSNFEEGRHDWYPVVPHLNSMLMDGLASYGYFLEGSMLLMEKCQAVCLLKGWQRSHGTRSEVLRAIELGLPIYVSATYLFCNLPMQVAHTEDPLVKILMHKDSWWHVSAEKAEQI